MNHYSRKYIAAIKAAAMKIKGATEVLHIKPRAYCIAKPAVSCAVFVTPPGDAAPHLQETQNATAELIHDDVIGVRVGDWVVVAYVCTPGWSGQRVIKMP